jgi:leucyl aminopeptidase
VVAEIAYLALGSHAIGMMGTDQALADRISQAGEATAERVWQLPL